MPESLIIKDRGEGGEPSLCPLPSAPLNHSTAGQHFPGLSLADEIPAEAFPVVLHALPDPIPACSDSSSVLFPGHLCLLLCLVCFLFTSDFSQNLGLCSSL